MIQVIQSGLASSEAHRRATVGVEDENTERLMKWEKFMRNNNEAIQRGWLTMSLECINMRGLTLSLHELN
ncbi:hypothetical protein K4A83_00915 [Spirulina subsalsa FACHB-351]|uniref:Uncharacterized protein n=1 Tax=Spirulina subsalsa FACHB-351 TaxID=234711 RepID=A0ABT3L150_9CYAN|nr:hypothetical protein [Spirulina subsalsa]MCW6034839.1 hypothetical protein [Spirulina subsalsa FACHB-351]